MREGERGREIGENKKNEPWERQVETQEQVWVR